MKRREDRERETQERQESGEKRPEKRDDVLYSAVRLLLFCVPKVKLEHKNPEN
jgi:hypothetical protein